MPETHFYGVKLLYRYEVCGEVFYEESILKVKANSFDDALAKTARYADDALSPTISIPMVSRSKNPYAI